MREPVADMLSFSSLFLVYFPLLVADNVVFDTTDDGNDLF